MIDEPERPSGGSRSNGTDETIRAQYDWASTPPTTAVLRTIAVALDRETTSLEPLYESIDPDALNEFLQSKGSSVTPSDLIVTFTVADRQVTVYGSGEVVVRADSLGR